MYGYVYITRISSWDFQSDDGSRSNFFLFFFWPFGSFFFVISYRPKNRTNDYWVSKQYDADLFLDFQGSAELPVIVASALLQRETFELTKGRVKRCADIHQLLDIPTYFTFSNICGSAKGSTPISLGNYGIHIPNPKNKLPISVSNRVITNESFSISKRAIAMLPQEKNFG